MLWIACNLPLNFILCEIIRFVCCSFWSSIVMKQLSQNGMACNSIHFIIFHNFVGQGAKQNSTRSHSVLFSWLMARTEESRMASSCSASWWWWLEGFLFVFSLISSWLCRAFAATCALSLVAVGGLAFWLHAAASLVVKHQLWAHGLSCCGTR